MDSDHLYTLMVEMEVGVITSGTRVAVSGKVELTLRSTNIHRLLIAEFNS